MTTLHRSGTAFYRRAKAWHAGIDLAVALYDITRAFPREELFGLTSQLRRAGVSVPSNIAEGLERETARDRRRFLTDAKGSVSEIETQLEISNKIELIDEPTLSEFLEKTDHLSRMLTNMRRNIGDRPD